MIRIETMVDWFHSTVGGMACNFIGHKDVVKPIGSTYVPSYFVVEAELLGIYVDEAKVSCKLSYSSGCPSMFFVEISTEHDFVFLFNFLFKEFPKVVLIFMLWPLLVVTLLLFGHYELLGESGGGTQDATCVDDLICAY